MRPESRCSRTPIQMEDLTRQDQHRKVQSSLPERQPSERSLLLGNQLAHALMGEREHLL
jgi:hypothetical protein